MERPPGDQTGVNSDSNNVGPNVVQRGEGHVWSRMGAGLLILIPLIVTLLVIRFIVKSVDEVFRGDGGFFNRWIENTFLDFPGIGIIFLVLVLYVVGVLVSGRLGRAVVAIEGAVLSRSPVVKNIYGVVKNVNFN